MSRLFRISTGRLHTPFLLLFVLSFVFVGLVPTAEAQTDTGKTAKHMIGYFSSWSVYDRNYLIKDVHTSGAADLLTHLNYAFADVRPDTPGGQVRCRIYDPGADYQKTWKASQSVDGEPVVWGEKLRGNFQQLKALKKIYPELKIMISLGGWSLSSHFSDMAQTPASRAAFVQSCVDLFIKGNLPQDSTENGGAGGAGAAAGIFDGIDVDWEFPGVCGQACSGETDAPEHNLPKPWGCQGSHCVARSTDTANFTALLTEFRTQLNAVGQQTGKYYPLTIATSSAPEATAKLKLSKIVPQVDFIAVMAYDVHGAWDTKTNFNAPLYRSPNDPDRARNLSIHESMQRYVTVGVPRDKLVMGVPYYGRGWTGVGSTNNGLYQPATGAAPGKWQAGIEEYKTLRAQYRAGKFKRYFDATTKNAYLYNASTGIFWSYDDAESQREKAKYIKAQQFAGAMIWELNGDTVTAELTKALYDELEK